MKKVLSLSIMALALIAFASSSVFAGPGCASKKDKTTTASEVSAPSKADAEKSCSSKDKATHASSKEKCNKADLAACAEKMGMTIEEVKKMCGENGTMTMQTISIKGMTCGSCEAKLTSVIEAVSGVKKVVNISYETESALVCVDKNEATLTSVTKAIIDNGYKAELMPAGVVTSAISSTESGDEKAAKSGCCAKKDDTKKIEDTK